MKKILVISAASLLLLAGCSDAKGTVSNPKQEVFKVGTKTITKEDLAKTLSIFNYDSVNSIARESLYDEYVPINDEINSAVDKELQALKDKVATGPVSWEDTLKNSGITEEEYKEKVLLPSARANALTKKYILDTFNDRVAQFKPIQLNVLEVANEETATKAIEAIEGGKSFEEAASEFGISGQYKGESLVAYDTSTVVTSDIYQAALATKINTIDKIQSKSGTSFYVFKLINNDPNTFKDEFVDELLKNASIAQEAYVYYLTEKKIAIYDGEIFKQFEKNYPAAIENKK